MSQTTQAFKKGIDFNIFKMFKFSDVSSIGAVGSALVLCAGGRGFEPLMEHFVFDLGQVVGWVAEWSKALVLGTSLFGGVGSNPTSVTFGF